MSAPAAPPELAQFNYARARFEPDDPRMAGFIEGLERINSLADVSPGFLWRLQTEHGHSIDIRPFPDSRKLITLSTWASIEALRSFVYRGAHAGYLARRSEWFEEDQGVYLVLWWRLAGTPPTIAEGMERLERLRGDGPGPFAFDMRNLHEPDGSRIQPTLPQGTSQ